MRAGFYFPILCEFYLKKILYSREIGFTFHKKMWYHKEKLWEQLFFGGNKEDVGPDGSFRRVQPRMKGSRKSVQPILI